MGLFASVLIVVDALVHSLIHHHHFWVHYVDPCLALLISGKEFVFLLQKFLKNLGDATLSASCAKSAQLADFQLQPLNESVMHSPFRVILYIQMILHFFDYLKNKKLYVLVGLA